MKKRIIGLALVVGMLLSMCASAWAVKAEVTKCVADYTAIHKIAARPNDDITIKVAVSATTYANTTASQGLAYPEATKLKVTYSDGILSDVTMTSEESSFSNGEYTLPSGASSIADEITLKGKLATLTNGTLTITAQLYNSNLAVTGSYAIQACSVTFDTGNAPDEKNIGYPYNNGGDYNPSESVPVYGPDNDNPLTNTVADPDSTNWNGLDPTFGVSGGNDKDKPKIATSKFEFTKTTDDKKKALTAGIAEDFKIEIEGPLLAKTSPDTGYDLSQPHALINVYVAGKDANKLWGTDKTKDIQLNSADIKTYAIPFRVTSWDVKQGGKTNKPVEVTTLTIAYNGAHVAYKGFPLTVSAANDKTGNKPVTKTYKIDINGRSVPQWVDSAGIAGDAYDKDVDSTDVNGVWTKKNTTEVVVNFTGNGQASAVFTASADAPYTVEAKGIKSDSGLVATAVQPSINKWGEVTKAGFVVVAGAFAKTDKTEGKEQKANVTMTAAGNVKKTSAKATVIGKVSPFFDPKKITSKDVDGETRYYLTGIKRVEAGKVPSIKFAAKGSKTITYELVEGEFDLEDHGLSFDAKKGAVIALDSKKKDTKPTLGSVLYDTGEKNDDGAAIMDEYYGFKSFDIAVKADNGVGDPAVVWAEVAITGPKPKFKTKTITLSRDTLATMEDGTVLVDYPIELSNVVDSEDNVVYSFVSDTDKTALSAVGLTIANDEGSEGYLMILSSKDIKATKGAKANITADYYGASNKAAITVVIVDPAPEIEVAGSADATITASTGNNADGTKVSLNLKLTDATKPSDGAKIAWKITDNPASKSNLKTLKLTADGTDSSKAVLDVQVKKGFTDTKTGETIKLTAQNPTNKLTSEKFTVTLNINPASAASTDVGSRNVKAAVVVDADGAAPEAEAEAEEAEEEAAEEAKLTFGAPRTAANLTATQQAFLKSKGYTVIAVLPEVTADKDGQAEIAVELDEDAPEGAKLVYIPFPKNAEETDDDKIADFFDEEGAAIENVPAGKNIKVAPWFRAGVTYEPVIAAEDK